MRATWILLLVLLIPMVAKASTGKWEFNSSVDEFTDEKKAFAMIEAEGGADKGFIIVGCYPLGIEVKVGAGKYVGDKEIDDNVKYRIDSNEFVVTTMSPTSRNYVFINDKDSKFLKDLMSGKKVVIQLTNYDYETSKARFTLNGANNSITKVLSFCKDK